MFQLSFNNKNIWSQELNEIKNAETNIKQSNILGAGSPRK